MVLNSQVIKALPPCFIINHPEATRKTRKKNANSILYENITLKQYMWKGSKRSDGQTGCKQAPRQKCLQLQVLDKDRKIEFSRDDISQGAKLII